MVLTPAQAKKFYDKFGKKQDAQSFYEDYALNKLIEYSEFETATSVCEFGCGTGRFGHHLLSKHLAPDATYVGTDISQTMIDIAQHRFSDYKNRAKVVQSDGSIKIPIADHTIDRFISSYVLDLLSVEDMRETIIEAKRLLVPGGKLCLVSLTFGVSILSRIIAATWMQLFHLLPKTVGGCRPIRIKPLLDTEDWIIEYHQVVTQFGVPSEVLVASKRAQDKKLK